MNALPRSLRTLPEPPRRGSGVPADVYGRALFAFVLAEECIATMDDEQIALALHASGDFLTPAYLDAVRARITNTRRLLAETQVRRAAALPQPYTPPATPQDKPNIGPMAPLQPAPIARPPAGSAVRPVPAFDF